ncbi:MAG TPA: hypothetical protein VFJ51_05580, partial [Nitrososphaeraceae archaeon]|nr:hypothetical protein [Nitrososphaeraceae archaeon]
MSSKKAERKNDTATAEIGETVSAREYSPDYERATVNRALDETKDNIKRSIDEARKEIPRYTQAANEYQEQTIQAARELADNYVESQKEIINSLQSAWIPQLDKANKVFTLNWMSPRYL